MTSRIKYIIHGAAALLLTGALTYAIATSSHNISLKRQVKKQEMVIDSLLAIRRNSVAIQLYVTDKSVNKIYGRYNKGTIQMPNEKIYLLEIDSSQFRIK